MSFYEIKLKNEVANRILLMKDAGTLFDRFVEWKIEGDASDMAYVFNALTAWSNDMSQLLQDILIGEVKIEVVDPKYIVILKDVHYDRNSTHWNFVVLEPDSDGDLVTKFRDRKEDIEPFTKAQYEHLPLWAKHLAEEV